MRKSAEFTEQIRGILEQSFDDMRGQVYRPAVTQLNSLESELIGDFTAEAATGVGENVVRQFVDEVKLLHGTRIAFEEQLNSVRDELIKQLRPNK